jgi:hypothetical protein
VPDDHLHLRPQTDRFRIQQDGTHAVLRQGAIAMVPSARVMIDCHPHGTRRTAPPDDVVVARILAERINQRHMHQAIVAQTQALSDPVGQVVVEQIEADGAVNSRRPAPQPPVPA